MLAEIFMLRLEATARVSAQEEPKYSPPTGAEWKTSQEGTLLNIWRWRAAMVGSTGKEMKPDPLGSPIHPHI
jgi:hypothetical protein